MLEGDAHLETLLGCELLRHLPVERLERVGKLGQIGAQHRLLAQTERLGQAVVPGDVETRSSRKLLDLAQRGSLAIPRGVMACFCAGGGPVARLAGAGVLCLRATDRGDRVASAVDLGEAGVEGVLSRAHVRLRFRRIELEQQIARLHRLAGLDVDRRHLAGIERLDHLGMAGRLDLALRDRVHVEAAEEGPDERCEREGADRSDQHERRRRRRRFEDLERSRQEFAVSARDRGSRLRRARRNGLRDGRGRGAFVHARALA